MAAVLRQQATERPWSSPLNKEHRQGTFACAGCALPLFSSSTKFESGTGWPSFWAPLHNAIGEDRDVTFGMLRVEVHCRRCGGHLGHVFNDGPRPTGLRYCMNGAALMFVPGAADGGTADGWRPLHPAGAAVRVRARRPSLRAQHAAAAAGHGAHLHRGGQPGGGGQPMGGAGQPGRPLDRAGADGAVRAGTVVAATGRPSAGPVPARGCTLERTRRCR
ncbi:hypothetical protein G6F65_018810 [Rhizopus arrhizus]|nr:hypothetical protein G6F65_018810 [Rhizopus arrhizus]